MGQDEVAVVDRPPRRVVVIDDDLDARLICGISLRNDPDFTPVGEAGSLAAGLALVAATQPEIIVVDRVLPDSDAVAGMGRLRAAAPDATIVVLSAQPAVVAERPALDAGADAYLDKSALDRFASALRRVTARDADRAGA